MLCCADLHQLSCFFFRRYSNTNWNHIDYFDCNESGEHGWLSHWVTTKNKNKVEEEKKMYEGVSGYGPGAELIHSYDSASAINTPRNIFFPIRKCLLAGSTYPCPNDPVRALLTDISGKHWIEAQHYPLEKLVYPMYGKCNGDCPRRNKKADLEKIKEAICGLHQGEWPSLHGPLLKEFGKDVCSPYLAQKYTAWREESPKNRETRNAKVGEVSTGGIRGVGNDGRK